MAVQSFGEQFTGNGHDESHAAFKASHEANTHALINLAAGRKSTAPHPPYDPNHPHNQWPVMIYHPAKAPLSVGFSLAGIKDPEVLAKAQKANENELNFALTTGYRMEPYAKPQIAVHDPALEKQMALKREEEMRGQIAILNEKLAKLLTPPENPETGRRSKKSE